MNRTLWRPEQLQILREKQEGEYQIDEEELMEYAEHIGIQLPEEEYLLEFAVEGLRAKLPPDWVACLAPDQSTIFFNTTTGQMQEEHPLDQILRQVVIRARSEQNQENEHSNENSNYQASNQNTNLSQIAEDQNEMVNQSQIYQRQRVNNVPDNLRLPINAQEIRRIHEAHQQTKPLRVQEVIQQNQKIDLQKLKGDIVAQIQELKKQQKLKLQLLCNLEKRNGKLTNALKHKIKDNKRHSKRSHKYQNK